MKFFIDTANIPQIKEAASIGILDGVTTNPSLIAKEDGDPNEILQTICDIVPGPVSAEVVSTDWEGMVKEGLEYAKLAENIAVKVPMMKDGVRACKELSSKGIMVNVTLVFSTTQAILAAKAGAAFVSPFVGRLDDIGHFGMSGISEIVQVFRNYDAIKTEILVASVRNPLHVIEAGMMGADIATIPFSVIEKMFKHPLSDIGLKNFLADWEKRKK